MLPLDSRHFSAGPRLGTPGQKHPDLHIYIIPRAKTDVYREEIEFDKWLEAELPNFDDVISLLDAAEDELDRMIKSTHNKPMPPRTVWKFRYMPPYPIRRSHLFHSYGKAKAYTNACRVSL